MTTDCIVCGNTMVPGLVTWHATCHSCHYEKADLKVSINDSPAHEQIHEADREKALKALREENFREIAGRIGALAKPGARRLLDIGCAHGWFLEHASARFEVLGIEPDAAVGQATAARGLPVRQGYFPDVLEAGERFDVLVFNDVIEHIPNIDSALAACGERLPDGGLLVLNLPNSRGLFYRLSKLFARLGLSGPFERLWQKGLPSPHVHYFDQHNLSALARRHGFDLVDSVELPALRANGLLERLRYVGKVSKAQLYAQYAAILVAIPVLKFFPSDIIVCTYRKRALA
jgi:2-polyprenyl-3-methyl-5-hydroxy-6-metoxy-1,4-benzoquinol methylase